jgi:hypothetical protein
MLFYRNRKDENGMKKTIMTFTVLGVCAILFSACAGDKYNSGYNSYDNRSSYDRKMDHEVQKDAYEASKMLSAQDIKNIEKMK